MKNSLKPLKPPAKLNFDFELKFPDGSGFHSKPCKIAADEMLRLSEERLPLVAGREDFEEQRLKSKCRVPFKL